MNTPPNNPFSQAMLSAAQIAERDAQRDRTLVKVMNVSEAQREGILPGGIGEIERWRLEKSSSFRAGFLTTDLNTRLPASQTDTTKLTVAQLIEAINKSTSEQQLAQLVTNAETREPVIEAAKARLLAIQEKARQDEVAARQAAALASGAGR